MNISPFSSGCGVVLDDLQLSALGDQQVDQLRRAFADHGLLFFRDQQLTPRQHLEFAKRFGSIVINKFFKTLEGYPEIAVVGKEQAQQTNIGGGWHTDHSYETEPAMGSILAARTLPAHGGDTCFANLYAAYEALNPDLQKKLRSLRAIHSNRHIYGKEGYYSTTDQAAELTGMDSVGDAIHPVVITHPLSGRKALYVNPAHTLGIEGWSDTESTALLEELYQHVDQPQFTCRFNWLPGSVAIWDNRSTWHFALNDYQGQARLMHRITLAGSSLQGAQ